MDLAESWYQRRRWLLLLWPLSLLFRVVVSVRRWAYRHGMLASSALPVPVWVVGNITVGGAGKTPLTIALVERLQRHNVAVGIVSRGYGGRPAPLPRLVRADHHAEEVGDEPLMIHRRTGVPVMVHGDRVAAAQALLQSHPHLQLILADDGLQHYALRRQREIAVVDGRRRFGNGWLLPAGPLREPLSRLRQVDAIVCNGGEPLPGELAMRLEADCWCNLAGERRATLPAQQRLWAVAGIAHPRRFFHTLAEQGVAVEHEVALPDHFPLSDAWMAEHIPADVTVLMTAKDAVKLTSACLVPVWYLSVNAVLDEAAWQHLLAPLTLTGEAR